MLLYTDRLSPGSWCKCPTTPTWNPALALQVTYIGNSFPPFCVYSKNNIHLSPFMFSRSHFIAIGRPLKCLRDSTKRSSQKMGEPLQKYCHRQHHVENPLFAVANGHGIRTGNTGESTRTVVKRDYPFHPHGRKKPTSPPPHLLTSPPSARCQPHNRKSLSQRRSRQLFQNVLQGKLFLSLLPCLPQWTRNVTHISHLVFLAVHHSFFTYLYSDSMEDKTISSDYLFFFSCYYPRALSLYICLLIFVFSHVSVLSYIIIYTRV